MIPAELVEQCQFIQATADAAASNYHSLQLDDPDYGSAWHCELTPHDVAELLEEDREIPPRRSVKTTFRTYELEWAAGAASSLHEHLVESVRYVLTLYAYWGCAQEVADFWETRDLDSPVAQRAADDMGRLHHAIYVYSQAIGQLRRAERDGRALQRRV
jgi:hypothetical protein